ncbi:MAG: 1,4-alpha-glucan branching enzyme, partial [Candidatus Atribacteria bacterium]|nr:1,4-alpha-glucan branching enzyme [Candidatus Atribacteria bacterium]
CKDDHGLYQFDGTSLYEYQDMKKRENQNWGTAYFDLGKNEVISFLVSNAVFWLDVFHIDGLRTDAVASILYLDYEKNKNQWNPNKYDGRENLEAIKFLRILNEALFDRFPYIMSIAEESTSWPLVSAPCYMGGLGFNYKWNMGWMNDLLKYMEIDAINRKWNHDLITFSLMYTYTENYVLPLSHDEVVHGKKSLIDKMWGDYWKKFASLRMFYAYMMAHPGKKLLFMGGEFAQFREWNFNESLEWSMIDFEMHGLMHKYVRHLNHFYKSDNSLWELDHNRDGFVWVDANNYNQSIISFIRRGKQERDYTIVICNFTPEVYEDYNVDVFELGEYEEVFNSDMGIYGGSNVTNEGIIKSIEKQSNDKPYSIKLRIPPLATIYIKPII